MNERGLRRCVVHLGMPKTGSTSIQSFLSADLSDPGYRYLGFGQGNGSNALCTLFADNPEHFWCYRSGQLKVHRIPRYRARFARLLSRDLRAARAQGVCPILSGEEVWRFSRDELVRLRDRLGEEGYLAQIVVYLRPYAELLESGFQQWVIWDRACDLSALTAVSGRGGIGRIDYAGRLQVLAEVFGHAQLIARPFTRKSIGDRGVIKDFCSAVGIEQRGQEERRNNESLTLDAIRVMVALNTHSVRRRPRSLKETGALVHCLAAMPGPPLRFCPSLLAPIAPELERQHHLLRQRFNVDLGEPLPGLTEEARVACEEDLFCYSPTALTWLAATLGSGTLAPEPTAAAVAAWVDRRRYRLLLRHAAALVGQRSGLVRSKQ